MVHPSASATRPSPDGSRPQHGLTLVELAIVLALVAIFASLAGPSFRQLVARQRVHSVASAITESLWVARAEALKRNRDVGFVFVDAATDWSVPDPDGGATPLLTQTAQRSVSSATEGGAAVQFTFNAYGRLSSGTGWIELSDAGAGVYRCLTVATTGRATSTEGKCA
ncbi:MAG TPA: GspH/FimT family pseudopilin [Burkholderiaceae bacterium]|nr:GspH/FimT family pseudopilin [Burkholderiaceae bacterium]